MTLPKLDLAKSDKTYYTAGNTPELVQFDPLLYLSFEGQGAPESSLFEDATEALYTVAYGVKGHCKAEIQDFTVPKLEGQWWVNSDRYGLEVPKEEWHWKLLIRMPAFVTPEIVNSARDKAFSKKNHLEPIQQVVLDTIHEGLCIQIMHIGPYSTEPDTLAKMYAYMEQHHYVQVGLHHEIYLSDPRKAASSTMKTILRAPVRQEH
jgi:hypothetical protein